MAQHLPVTVQTNIVVAKYLVMIKRLNFLPLHFAVFDFLKIILPKGSAGIKEKGKMTNLLDQSCHSLARSHTFFCTVDGKIDMTKP